MSEAQPNKPEGETKETVEEKSPAVLDRPSESEKAKDEPIKAEGGTEETVEEKSSSVLDEPSESEKTKDELWDEYEELQEELESVQKRSFKIVRDKFQRSWDIIRRNMEETKARTKTVLGMKQGAEKCHIAGAQRYEEKLKHLKTAQHNEIVELKMAALAETTKTQGEHVESEIELHKKIHDLKADRREEVSCNQICITVLKQKHQDELWTLKRSCRRRVSEIEIRYQEKLNSIPAENSERTQCEEEDTDEDAGSGSAEEDEGETPEKQDDTQSKWTEDMNRKRSLVARTDPLRDENEKLSRTLITVNLEIKRRTELLEEVEAKMCESRQKMLAESTAMAKRLKRDKKISTHELCEIRELYLEHQLLELKYEQFQQESDKLQKSRTKVILHVQQKSSLEDMFLEKKVQAMEETVEKMQMTLWAVLTFLHGEQTAAKNIKDLFESKDITIKVLKDEVSQKLKEYEGLEMEAMAFDIHAEDKRLPVGDIKKSARRGSEDTCVSLYDLVLALAPLCISVRKDTLQLLGR